MGTSRNWDAFHRIHPYHRKRKHTSVYIRKRKYTPWKRLAMERLVFYVFYIHYHQALRHAYTVRTKSHHES